MSTKDPNLSQKPSYGNNTFTSNSDPQFTNLNLNQNHKCQGSLSVQSKSISNKNDKILINKASTKLPEFTNSDQKNCNLKSKIFDNSKNSPILSPFVKREKAKNNLSTSNNSTLSLHIVAYENSVKTDGSSNQDNSGESITKVQKNSDIGKKWKNANQIFFESTSAKSSIEIPRQQKEEEAVKSEPEIMQFKASQKLLHPNQQQQQQQSKKKCENKKIDGNSTIMDTSVTSEVAQNCRKINHCRIMQVLSNCTKHFQRIFKQRWSLYQKLKKNAAFEWCDTAENRLQLVKLCSSATPQMKESMKNDNIELWDITLLNCGIQALRSGGAVNKLEDTVINCIREIRNKIVHGKPELSDTEFQKHFNQLSTFMIKLGDTQSDMDELKEYLMKIGVSKVEPKIDNTKIEFRRKKDEAKKLFEAEKYNEAIDIYDQILQLSGISPEDQALIYSNKSAAYLSLKTKDSYLMAKRDANITIERWPTWWRGYFRLGKAEAALENLREAENAFKDALILNPGSNDICNELGAITAKIGFFSREDYLNTSYLPDSSEIELKRLLDRTGLTEEEYMKRNSDVDAVNGDKWRMGHNGQQDFTRAAAYYAKSAKNGNTGAMFNLARMFRNGEGVERNYDEAIKWFTKAATSTQLPVKGNGIADAQHALGIFYFDGEGVKKDYQKAFEWYKRAADNCCAGAANNLGMMYAYGYGVKRSPETSFSYYKFAAESGDTSAMKNLAESYFLAYGTPVDIPNPHFKKEGIKWLKAAISKGDLRAEKRLEQIEKMSDEQILEESMKYLSLMTPKNEPLDRDKEQFDGCIREAAKKGSDTAKRQLEIKKQMNKATDAFKRKNSAELVAALSKALRLDPQIVDVPELYYDTVFERYDAHSDELDAIICYLRIVANISETLQHAMEVIDKNLKIFSNDEILFEMKICVYMYLNEFDHALIAAKDALKIYPNSLRFLLCYAVALSLQNPSPPELIEALDAFLAIAPPDHHKVPSCHYLKAQYYLHNPNDDSKFKASFEAGLAAEKKQLPCFMPYFFPDKGLLEKRYKIQTTDFSKFERIVSSASLSSRSLNEIKMNAKRRHFILHQRKNFLYFDQQTSLYQYPRLKSSLAAKAPDVSCLKNIMLKDMFGEDEKFYEGFVLKATVIDWPLPMLSLTVLIEDENGDVERLIACFDSSQINPRRDAEIMKKFRPNVKLSIINPYKKISPMGLNVIRVENPACLIDDDTNADEKCSCCGKQAKTLLCSKCRMSRYCTKECQMYDWNDCDHKSVCKALQKYAIGKKLN